MKYLGIEPFATFKGPFATCGGWRMGWTTLLHILREKIGSLARDYSDRIGR